MKLSEISVLPAATDWTQTDFDRHFLSLANEASKSSDDPKAAISPQSAVGAVITLNNRVVGSSANRLPPALRDSYRFSSIDAPERYELLEHAERCAIFDASKIGIKLTNATIYCTRFPCIDCARTIVYFSFSRLVVANGISGEGKWVDSQRSARRLLRLSDVKIRYLAN